MQQLLLENAALNVRRFKHEEPKPFMFSKDEAIPVVNLEKLPDPDENSLEKTNQIPIDSMNFPMLEVQGIPCGTSEQMVKLFLESARSGGGVLKHIDYHKDDGYALVVYESKEGIVGPCLLFSFTL